MWMPGHSLAEESETVSTNRPADFCDAKDEAQAVLSLSVPETLENSSIYQVVLVLFDQHSVFKARLQISSLPGFLFT